MKYPAIPQPLSIRQGRSNLSVMSVLTAKTQGNPHQYPPDIHPLPHRVRRSWLSKRLQSRPDKDGDHESRLEEEVGDHEAGEADFGDRGEHAVGEGPERRHCIVDKNWICNEDGGDKDLPGQRTPSDHNDQDRSLGSLDTPHIGIYELNRRWGSGFRQSRSHARRPPIYPISPTQTSASMTRRTSTTHPFTPELCFVLGIDGSACLTHSDTPECEPCSGHACEHSNEDSRPKSEGESYQGHAAGEAE